MRGQRPYCSGSLREIANAQSDATSTYYENGVRVYDAYNRVPLVRRLVCACRRPQHAPSADPIISAAKDVASSFLAAQLHGTVARPWGCLRQTDESDRRHNGCGCLLMGIPRMRAHKPLRSPFTADDSPIYQAKLSKEERVYGGSCGRPMVCVDNASVPRHR